jgi:hypothetical protein
VLAAVLLGGAGARAEEPPPGSGGALKIAADPPRLELGRDEGSELRIAAPPEVEELTVSASAGRIEGVRRLPGGGFTARLRAPTDHVPRVAIVAALGRGARGLEDGWLAIPMAGRGTARVRGEPGSVVTLRVGDRTFGPALAGADGLAAIPVVVPPGIREGHQGFRPIDLRIPETALLHAIADRADVRADREEKIRVLAYVVAPHGAARRDALAFEPSRGSVGVTEREPGAFSAIWTLPPGPAGDERLVVRIPAASASRAVVRVAALAGPPAIVAVSFDRDALVAGGEAASVTARALDAAGNPVPAALVLDVQGGDLSGVSTPRPGEVVARVSAGERLRGDQAVVRASAPALGISGARALALRPEPAATGRFDRQQLVRGDGRTEVTLRGQIADRFGNPVSTVPEVSAQRGTVVAVAERGRGAFEVRYLPPEVDHPVQESVVARSGAARATLEPVIAPRAPAFRLEAGAGIAQDVSGPNSLTFAATIAAERPADLAPALRLGLEPALRVEAGVLGLSGATLGTLLAGGSVRRPLSHDFSFTASAGLGVAFGEGELSPAGRAAFSLDYGPGRVKPFGEISVLGARSPSAGTITAVGLSAGVRFGLEDRHDRNPDRR